MALGVEALTRFQSGTEATLGTLVPATRINYVKPGTFMAVPTDFYKPEEDRNSYVRNYRSFGIKSHAELQGMAVEPTFEDIALFLQAGAKGAVTGGAGDVGTPKMYTYTFLPTLTSNDLKAFSWEAGDNIQGFALNGCVLNRWDFGITASQQATMTMDWLGLTAVKQAFTGALSDRVVTDIVGALGKVYIDSTTIGSTAQAYPLDFKISVDNKYEQLFVLAGAISPTTAFRPVPMFVELSGKLAFDSTTEYDKFTVAGRGVRKIRLNVDGPIIHDAVVNNLAIDWYGFWDAYDFGSEGGLRVCSIKGESHYDTTFSNHWQVVVKNLSATLP